MVDDVPDAVAHAIEVTPADGQVVVTGSLYVVSPARAVLVLDVEPPGPCGRRTVR